jgi:hypothetical protein
MTEVLYTDILFWKADKPFLSLTENDFTKRLTNKLTTFEVLTSDTEKIKLYLDIDCSLKQEDKDLFNEELCTIVETKGEQYIRNALKCLLPDCDPNFTIATSHSLNYMDFKDKKESTKISVRYFISNIRATKKEQEKFVKRLNEYANSSLVDIWDYIPKMNVLFDEGIYNKNRKMRCINTSKPNEKRPLVLKSGSIKSSIITGCFDDVMFDLPALPPIVSNTNIGKAKPIPVAINVTSSPEEETDEETDDEKVKEKCENITKFVDAILEIKSTYFDEYSKWAQLGYLIYNVTKGSEEGAELYFSFSLKFGTDSGKKHTRSQVFAQYHKTQPNRKKEDKLYFGSLFKWLEELDPKHPLLLEGKKMQLRAGQLTAEQVRQMPEYIEYREKFEKINFKLNNPLKYCEEHIEPKKGKYLIFRDRNDFLERYRDEKNMPIFLIKGGMGSISKLFSELWLDDTEKRKYAKIRFDPCEEPNENEFNSFPGWINKDENVLPMEEKNSDFIKLMEYLFPEKKVFEYMKCWIASIIQRPNIKTKVAPILFSKTHGTGKNSFVDGVIAILGKNNCGMVECIEDITKNFNAHLCNKLFIYGDEICANAKKVADKLKAVVTRPEQTLEKKNVDSILVDDYTNWLFTSNNENNIKVEEGDRRFLMVHCNENKQNQYSIASYAEIGDNMKIKELYQFFAIYKQSEESIKLFGRFNIGSDNVIETEYKKEMIYENRPAYIQMLYKAPNELIFQKFEVTKLFNEAQKYAKQNYLTCNFTIQEFSKQIKKYVGCFQKRTSSSSNYTFPSKNELLKVLYQTDEIYYRYVFQLDEDHIPTFVDDD